MPPRILTVNGQIGARIESLRPGSGVVIAEWQLGREVIAWIWQTLRDRSPVVSGDYKRGHLLFADGALVEEGQKIPNASTFKFINAVPYARKIEIGKTKSGRSFVVQVEPRIYERTYKDAKGRFGNIAQISTGFEPAPSGYSLKKNQAHRSFSGKGMRVSKRQRPDRVAGSAVSVPFILVSLRSA
ncbi:MAG TPA: hypothetical protein VGC77_14205 [Rhodopseudomonas sp.]|uniref:hypothetical protein n=1 Tax=Rhodopseudomonas sp. TaxID=1078 RepID=UPI002EDA53DB